MRRKVSSRGPAFESGGARWWIPAGGDADGAARLVDRALAEVERGAQNEKTGRRKELFRLALVGDAPDHLLKVNHYARGASRIQRLGRGKSRRELRVAAALAARGIETPVPVAAGEVRRAGSLQRCYLLVPLLPDVDDLQRLASRSDGASERRGWAEALGALARRLHDEGLCHGDFAANNVLIRRARTPVALPVDFERARFRSRMGAGERAAMLAKLERSLDRPPAIERMRFAFAYVRGDRTAAHKLWRDVERAAADLAHRDLRRLRRISTAHRRRFEHVAVGPWAGWARRDTERLPAVEKALAEPRIASDPGIEARGELWEWRSRGDPASAEVWARAQLLWRRGLAPRPVALLRRGSETRLWLERTRSGTEPDPEAAAHAARDLAVRLRALGRLRPGRGNPVALETSSRGGLRALWLDPAAFEPGRPTDAEQRTPRHRS